MFASDAKILTATTAHTINKYAFLVMYIMASIVQHFAKAVLILNAIIAPLPNPTVFLVSESMDLI